LITVDNIDEPKVQTVGQQYPGVPLIAAEQHSFDPLLAVGALHRHQGDQKGRIQFLFPAQPAIRPTGTRRQRWGGAIGPETGPMAG
jgi:hypothetical protein